VFKETGETSPYILCLKKTRVCLVFHHRFLLLLEMLAAVWHYAEVVCRISPSLLKRGKRLRLSNIAKLK